MYKVLNSHDCQLRFEYCSCSKYFVLYTGSDVMNLFTLKDILFLVNIYSLYSSIVAEKTPAYVLEKTQAPAVRTQTKM